jgi:Asp-tRNA(Asn)/Glu-tRNA(Gln) amidotransferase A subunit family amidase
MPSHEFLRTPFAAIVAGMTLSVAPAQAKPFVLEEATGDSIHAAYRDGSLTATELVKRYLARLDAYDQKGPALHAFITVNPAVLEEAARLDAEYKSKKGKVGPLHGIPIG